MCSVSEMSVSEGTDRIIATTSTLPQEKCAHLFPKVDMFQFSERFVCRPRCVCSYMLVVNDDVLQQVSDSLTLAFFFGRCRIELKSPAVSQCDVSPGR